MDLDCRESIKAENLSSCVAMRLHIYGKSAIITMDILEGGKAYGEIFDGYAYTYAVFA